MKKFLLFSIVCVSLFLSSCASIGTPAGAAILYADVQSGVTATSNTVGTKQGSSKATNILGLVATGDASIQAAARNGGITKISHVDQKQHTILGIISTYETIVYGE